jgi:hypothetical protein
MRNTEALPNGTTEYFREGKGLHTGATQERYLQALPSIAQSAESVHICRIVMLPTGATFSPCSALPRLATQRSCQ